MQAGSLYREYGSKNIWGKQGKISKIQKISVSKSSGYSWVYTKAISDDVSQDTPL